MKAFVEKNKHNMCLAKASAKKSCAYKKMSVVLKLGISKNFFGKLTWRPQNPKMWPKYPNFTDTDAV